ncbi:Ger(x)C family spore germination protein [Neobacillus sp. DY30]|uniref:Ger(x)C family spore germination protein n=1 Tax=Neobacillus sp. DY30 TaxID=3047871 RepID=UPI0024C06EC9|nr:Ger(x)C family spore germination protein [Neobacillus sp. DY30]WHX97984.1 Ger(x)C family spore germination protein [Neobacillus sp. DY30]
MKQSHNNVRSLKDILPILALLFLTGCWSSHEIEEIGLSVGLALDEGKESTIDTELKQQGGGYNQTEKITMTYQIVTPQGTGSESKGGGSQQKPYLNISETGDSIHQMIREFSLRSDRPIFSPHLKVIVISEDLVRKYRLEQLVDEHLRDNEIRPSCLVFISKGLANEALESKEPGKIPAFRLIGISDNEYRTTRILPPMSLAKLGGKMDSGSSFLLQNVIPTNGEVNFSGAAVISGKTKKLLGFLNEEELEGITWITGKGKGGLVKTFDAKNQPIIYEVKTMKSKIIPHVNGNNISFDVKIESEGRLSENWKVSGESSENKFLKRAEEAAEEEVKRLVSNVGEKIQKDYQVDVAGFGTRLRIEHPKVWEKVKKDWDQTFSEVPIEYNVKLTIRDYGSSSFKN